MAEEFSITNWLQEAKDDPKKVAPIFVIIGVGGFIVWKFLYSPKAVLIDKELKKNKRLIGEMKNFKNASSQIEDIKLDIEDKKTKFSESLKLCYKEMERTVFLRRVRELATLSKINIRSLNPLPDENTKIGVLDAKKFSVQFSYIGDLTRLLTFMRLIELEPKTTFINIPNLIPNSEGKFDLKLTVSTILLPDVVNFEGQESSEEVEEEEEED